MNVIIFGSRWKQQRFCGKLDIRFADYKICKILLVTGMVSDNNATITNLEEKWKEELF